MNTKLLTFLIFGIFTFTTSCKNDKEDISEDIAGTYFMTSYETHNGVSTPNTADKVTITRSDDNEVELVIDYVQTEDDGDIKLGGMEVSESSNTILIEQEYANATANGSIVADELQLTIEYTDSDEFVILEASR